MKWIFIAFFIFLASLFFRQQQLPESLVEAICEKLSVGDWVVSCDSVSVGYRYGIHLRGIRLYDRSRRDNLQPMLAIDGVSVWIVQRRVRIDAVKLPRLHDAYYGIVPEKPSPPSAQSDGDGGRALAAFKRRLARIPAFTLELVRPEILGVAPERVVGRVVPGEGKVELSGAHLDWPDQDCRMGLDAGCTYDFGKGLIDAEIRGTARHAHIRPLLEVLDLKSSYRYMGGYPFTGKSGFTEVTGPVPAYCRIRYDFAARDFNLELDLHPDMGRYNGVRLRHIDGRLGVHTRFTDSSFDYDIAVGPLVATDLRDRRMSGWLTVHGTNGLNHLEFDARSDLEKQDTLDIMGYLNEGTLDLFRCETPPRVSARGQYQCDDVNIPLNDLSGGIAVDRGEMFGMKFTDFNADYRLKGGEIAFTNFTAKGFAGGDVDGWARFHLPIAAEDRSGFRGRGYFGVRNGRILRIPLFMVLTDALADNVPGIDKIISQGEISCDYSISNGVFSTDRLVVQGGLFCIKLNGTCNLTTGEIDFIAHCTVMKEESLLGRYIQPVLWPFTKLLTEFHCTGTRDCPSLRNTSVKAIGGLLKKAFD